MTSLDQQFLNSLFTAFGALASWLIKIVWDNQKEHAKVEAEMLAKIQSVEVLIAGDYVKKDEFRELSRAIFAKLDKIENKIDGKQDK